MSWLYSGCMVQSVKGRVKILNFLKGIGPGNLVIWKETKSWSLYTAEREEEGIGKVIPQYDFPGADIF